MGPFFMALGKVIRAWQALSTMMMMMITIIPRGRCPHSIDGFVGSFVCLPVGLAL